MAKDHVALTLRLSRATHVRLRASAKRTGSTLNGEIATRLARSLEQETIVAAVERAVARGFEQRGIIWTRVDMPPDTSIPQTSEGEMMFSIQIVPEKL